MEAKEASKTREALAAAKGGKVVCGVIEIPGEACNTTNLLANLSEIDALVREIVAKRKGA